MAEHQPEETVDRRRMLKRAGVVLAGAVGTGLVANTPPAAAAAGDNVKLGIDNNAEATSTGITNSASMATLDLGNKATVSVGGQIYSAPSLRLRPAGVGIAPSQAGSLGVSADGVLWHTVGDGDHPDYVYSSFTATTVIPIKPTRLLDSRLPEQRANILNPGEAVDGLGRLIGGRWAYLSVAPLVTYGDALFGNLVAVGPTESGWIAVAPWTETGIPKPTTSNLNYVAGQVLANFFVCGIGHNFDVNPDDPRTDIIGVYTEKTSHVIVDAFAVTASSYNLVRPDLIAAGAGVAAAGVKRRSQVRTYQGKGK